MKRHVVIVLVLAMFALSACGGSSSSSDATQTAASDEVASVINTAIASAIAVVQDNDPTANVAAQIGSGKTSINPLTCTWYDENDNVIAAIVDNLDTVAKWVCESDSCTNADGTETVTISNTLGTPFFTGTPFADGIVVVNAYENCTVETVCGPATLDGTVTITGTGFTSDPCSATITVVSNNMSVDGSSTASVNMTMNFTAAGGCDSITDVSCEDNLSEDSTMSVGGTTYNKAQICDMIDNPTCP